MKTSQLKALLFLIVVVLSHPAYGQGKQTKILESAKSPDGIFTADWDANDSTINITNHKTGKKYAPFDYVFEDCQMKWTGDSKSLVFFQPGKDSLGVIVWQSDDKWDLVSPDSGGFYIAIRIKVDFDSVKVTYIVHKRYQKNSPYYIWSFVYHTETALRTDETVKKIDEGTYLRLKQKAPISE